MEGSQAKLSYLMELSSAYIAHIPLYITDILHSALKLERTIPVRLMVGNNHGRMRNEDHRRA